MNIRPPFVVQQQRQFFRTPGKRPKNLLSPKPSRLLIAFGTVLILGLLVTSAVSVWNARKATLADSQRSLSNLSTVLSQRISDPFERVDAFLTSIAHLAAFELGGQMAGRDKRIYDLLFKEVSMSPYLLAVYVLDATGEPVYSSRSFPPNDASFAGDDFFIAVRDNPKLGFYFGTTEIGRTVPNQPKFFMSRKIAGQDGKFLGAAVASFDLRYFDRILASVDVGDRSVVTVSNENGAVLTRYVQAKGSRAVSGQMAKKSGPENFETAGDGTASDGSAPAGDGARHLVMSRQISSYPLVASVSLPLDLALRPWVRETVSTGLRTAISSAIIAALIFFLVKQVARDEEREEVLRRSEERYALAMAGTNDALWDWDIAEGEIYVSPRIFDFLPADFHWLLPEKNVVSRSNSGWFLDAIHPDDFEGWKEAMVAHLKGETDLFAHECRLATKSGPEAWVHCRGLAVRGEDGKPYRLVGSVSNISERKKSEQSLHDRESRMRAILETAVDAIVTIDSAGIIETFNPAAERIFGYAAEEVIGRNVVCLMPERIGSKHDGYLKDYENTGKATVIGIEREVQGRRKDGSEFPMELSVSEMVVGGQRMFTGIVRDISARKSVERELERIRLSFADAQKLGHIGSWDWNIESGNLWWSDEIYRIFGQKPQAFGATYEAFLDTVHPEDRDFVAKSVNRALDGEPYEIDHRIIIPSGGERVVHEIGRVTFDASGQPRRMLGIVQDVTEQRHAEKTLEERERRYRDFVELMPLAILIFDRDRIVFSNAAAARLLDFSDTQGLNGLGVLDRIRSSNRDLIHSRMQRIFEDGTPLPPTESKWLCADGTTIDVEITATRVMWHEKSAVQFIALDISDRKQAESAKQNWETELRSFLDNMSETFYRTDAEGRIIMASRSIVDLLGYSVEEVAGLPMADYYANPNDRTKFLESLDLHGGRIAGYETKLKRKDGLEIWVSTNAQKRYDDQGKFIGIEGISRDVTERRRAEKQLRKARDELERRVRQRTDHLELEIAERKAAEAALRNSEARLKTIMDQAVDAIVTIDEKGLIESFNLAAEEMFGFSTEEVLGRNVKMLIPEPDNAFHDDYFAKRHDTRDRRIVATSRDVLGRRKDGSTFPIELGISELELGGRRVFSGILRDISDRKHAEEELQKALERADSANQAKSRFLSHMSHELRTPLNAILGFGELLAKDPEIASSNKKQFVHHILRGGEHLLRLINEILDISKIESETHSFDMQVVELAEPLRECLMLIGPLAEQYGITVNAECDHATLPTVRADPTRVKQVVLNLLSNAVKYNRSGGTVQISCRPADDRMVRITVTDTGTGIPEDRYEDLFKPFSRLGVEVTDIEGTGIGLALSKQLMELMGGRIGFESEVGKGSKFWVEFVAERQQEPRKPAADIPPLESPLKQAGKRRYSLLYVEDRPANLLLMEQIVQEYTNIRMVSAHNAELGLEIALKFRPDLILMDIDLPGMDGLEAIRRLKAEDATRDIPVIAVSANAMPDDVKKGMKLGIKDYLIKPIRVQKFLTAIEEVLPNSTRLVQSSSTSSEDA